MTDAPDYAARSSQSTQRQQQSPRLLPNNSYLQLIGHATAVNLQTANYTDSLIALRYATSTTISSAIRFWTSSGSVPCVLHFAGISIENLHKSLSFIHWAASRTSIGAVEALRLRSTGLGHLEPAWDNQSPGRRACRGCDDPSGNRIGKEIAKTDCPLLSFALVSIELKPILNLHLL